MRSRPRTVVLASRVAMCLALVLARVSAAPQVKPYGNSPPTTDGLLSRNLESHLAISEGATREFTPISLDPDGSAIHGIAFDRFRVIARATHAATAAGLSIDAAEHSSAVEEMALVLVAFPLKCGDRLIRPIGLLLTSSVTGPVAARDPGLMTSAVVKRKLFNYPVQENSMGAIFALSTLRSEHTVRVTYAESCNGSNSAVLPVRATPAALLVSPEPVRPAGVAAPDESVWIQALVSMDGNVTRATAIRGPRVLTDVVIATLARWRAEPARVNGSAVISDTLLGFRFK